MRSKMWLSGRNDRHESVGSSRTTWRHASTFEAMLSWVSMAPLGSPVVPEV